MDTSNGRNPFVSACHASNLRWTKKSERHFEQTARVRFVEIRAAVRRPDLLPAVFFQQNNCCLTSLVFCLIHRYCLSVRSFKHSYGVLIISDLVNRTSGRGLNRSDSLVLVSVTGMPWIHFSITLRTIQETDYSTGTSSAKINHRPSSC